MNSGSRQTPSHESKSELRVEPELWRRLKEHGDSRARDALVTHYLPLARAQARRYSSTGLPFEDLLQVSSLGLVKAVDRFNPKHGVVFATFAVPVIQGELKDWLAESGWAVRMPRRLQQLVRRVREANEMLTGRLGRAPTASEVADGSDLSEDEVREGMRAALAWNSRTEYLGRRATARRRSDVEAGVDEGFDRVSEVSTIERALATLSERERQALHLRYVEDLAQHEIARELGVSQRQVSRIIERAMERMHQVANPSPAPRAQPATD
jgi:RNA polymerase sigma-B factor